MSLKTIQEKLSKKGYNPGPIDGIWGPQTEKAISAAVEAAPVVKPKPKPEPGENPYSVVDHILHKDGQPVSYQQTEMHGGYMADGRPHTIIIHYTATDGLSSPLNWLTIRGDRKPGTEVSCHLIITKEGNVWQLSPFNVITWHARSANPYSIGIENVGLGKSWPEAQVIANIQIVECLAKHYPIAWTLGHEDVDPQNKVDPGPLYPWDRVWPAHEELI